jgi:hypothetical protein
VDPVDPDSVSDPQHCSKHISTGAFLAGDGAEFHNSGGDTSTEYTTHPEAADTVHNATIMESPTSIGSVEMPQVALQVFGKPAFKILLSPVFRICTVPGNVLIVLILIPGYSVA